MANEQHIKWILEGVDKWNSRREREDFTPDFEGADFLQIFSKDIEATSPRIIELEGANFKRANLRYSNLERANLGSADFVKADLRNSRLMLAKLNGADLQEAMLDNANLSGANLESTDLQVADFTNAILRQVNFKGAYFGQTYFKGADLSHAQIDGADLGGIDFTDAVLIEANLERATFYGSNFTNANFERANLRGANLQQVKFHNTFLKGASLRAVVLQGADLRGTDLRSAILLGTDLSGANLHSADLRGAYLLEADFSHATLDYANLEGLDFTGSNLLSAEFEQADVRSVIHAHDRVPAYGTNDGRTDLSDRVELAQEQLEKMLGDSGTIIPNHLKRPNHWIKIEYISEPIIKKDIPFISRETIAGALRSNGVALTFAVSTVFEQIVRYREKVRIDNELGATQPEHRDELLGFLDNILFHLEDLLNVVPYNNEVPTEEAVQVALGWCEQFQTTLIPGFKKYLSGENVGKAVVPVVTILGFGTIGALLTGFNPLGFGAGSYIGKLLVGELKSGVVIDKLGDGFSRSED